MKHIQTYKHYSINEELISLRKLWHKIHNCFDSWRDEKIKQVAKKISDKIDEKKNDPSFKEAIIKIKEEYDNLPVYQKEELKNKIEKLKETLPEKINIEEYNESFKMTIGNILKILGLTSVFFTIISILSTMFIPIVAVGITGVPLWKIVAISLIIISSEYLM
jgi:hypothetical protein